VRGYGIQVETFKATSERVMCTLTSADLEDVGGAWQKLFRTSLLARDLVPGGLRLSFSPDGEGVLRQLIEIERDCCRWITFVVEGPSVTLTAEGEGEAAIRTMWTVQPEAP
jgi:hypothetical protein